MVKHRKRNIAYSRREFLKASGRVGLWAGIGATAGHVYDWVAGLLGRIEKKGAQTLHNLDGAYDEKTKELEESKNPLKKGAGRVAEGVKKAEDWRAGLWRKVIGRDDEEVEEYRKSRGIEEENVGEGKETSGLEKKSNYSPETAIREENKFDRRGFLSSILHYFTGSKATRTGSVVGAGIGTIKSRHNIRKGISGSKRREEVPYLRDVSKEESGEPYKKGGLEKGVEEPYKNNKDKGTTAILIIGVLGLLASVIYSIINLNKIPATGLAISEVVSYSAYSLKTTIFNTGLLIASLSAITLSILIKKKNLNRKGGK